MRISAELLSRAEQRTNPLGQRELVLSGLGIPAIENMGAARDDFDSYDLSNNRLTTLDHFSQCPRVVSLQAAGNRIERVQVTNCRKNAPNVRTLSLANNAVSSLADVAAMGQAFSNLEFLDLTGNPVTRRQHYRLYTIHNIPSLKQLDFCKIKQPERQTAARLASSSAGAALESDVQQQLREGAVKTFTPGESEAGVAVDTFTVAEKERIRDLVAGAASAQDIEAIEQSVKRGILPKQLREEDEQQQEQQPVSKKQKV